MNKWQASIQSNGSRKYLGYFDTPEQAHEAYKAAASVLHGSFANFGNSAITHAKELLK
jgi:hypothetical protein